MALVNFLEKVFPLKKVKNITDTETICGELQDTLRCKKMAFYIATSYIANTISKCEFKVYRNHKEVKDELYYLLNVKANPNETASRLKFKLIQKLYEDGEALIFEHKDYLYCADSFNKDQKPFTGNLYTEISIDNETLKKSKKSTDVYYFNLENDKNFDKVKSLIDSMYEDYSTLLSYAISAYKATNSEKYTLDITSSQFGDKEFEEKRKEQLEQSLNKFINNPKAVYPQFHGYKLTNVLKSSGSTNSEDIRKIKQDIMETVAEAFKMPVSMLYGNMTNVKDIISHYLTFTIDPIANLISQELTSNSFSFEEWQKGCYIKVDTTAINHLDIFEIADKIEKTISTGIFCINEIREKLGETPLEDDFAKKHFITKNYSTIEEFLKEMKGGE